MIKINKKLVSFFMTLIFLLTQIAMPNASAAQIQPTIIASTENPIYIVATEFSGNYLAPSYNIEIERDFNQQEKIKVFNNTDQTAEVYYKIEGVPSDLSLDFVGYGYKNQPITIGSGQESEVQLSIFAQDAMKDSYSLQIQARDANNDNLLEQSNLTINVRPSEQGLSIRCIEENEAGTAAKIYEIKNNNIVSAHGHVFVTTELTGDLANYAGLNPHLISSRIDPQTTDVIKVLPNLWQMKNDGKNSVSGKLVIRGGGQTLEQDISFDIPTGDIKEITFSDLALYQEGNPYFNLKYVPGSGTATNSLGAAGGNFEGSWEMTYGLKSDKTINFKVEVGVTSTIYNNPTDDPIVSETINSDNSFAWHYTTGMSKQEYDRILAGQYPDGSSISIPAALVSLLAANGAGQAYSDQGTVYTGVYTPEGLEVSLVTAEINPMSAEGDMTLDVTITVAGELGSGAAKAIGPALGAFNALNGMCQSIAVQADPNISDSVKNKHAIATGIQAGLTGAGILLSPTVGGAIAMAAAGYLLEKYKESILPPNYKPGSCFPPGQWESDFKGAQCTNRGSISGALNLPGNVGKTGSSKGQDKKIKGQYRGRMSKQGYTNEAETNYDVKIGGESVGKGSNDGLTDDIIIDIDIPVTDTTSTGFPIPVDINYDTNPGSNQVTTDNSFIIELLPGGKIGYVGDEPENFQRIIAAPDYSVRTENINLNSKELSLIKGEVNTVSIKIRNIGTVLGYVYASAYIDNVLQINRQVIELDAYGEDVVSFNINNPAGTEETIKVVLEDAVDTVSAIGIGESNTANNIAERTFKVRERQVPEIIDFNAGRSAYGSNFTAEVEKALDVVSAEFYVDNTPQSTSYNPVASFDGVTGEGFADPSTKAYYLNSNNSIDSNVHVAKMEITYKTSPSATATRSETVNIPALSPRLEAGYMDTIELLKGEQDSYFYYMCINAYDAVTGVSLSLYNILDQIEFTVADEAIAKVKKEEFYPGSGIYDVYIEGVARGETTLTATTKAGDSSVNIKVQVKDASDFPGCTYNFSTALNDPNSLEGYLLDYETKEKSSLSAGSELAVSDDGKFVRFLEKQNYTGTDYSKCLIVLIDGDNYYVAPISVGTPGGSYNLVSSALIKLEVVCSGLNRDYSDNTYLLVKKSGIADTLPVSIPSNYSRPNNDTIYVLPGEYGVSATFSAGTPSKQCIAAKPVVNISGETLFTFDAGDIPGQSIAVAWESPYNAAETAMLDIAGGIVDKYYYSYQAGSPIYISAGSYELDMSSVKSGGTTFSSTTFVDIALGETRKIQLGDIITGRLDIRNNDYNSMDFKGGGTASFSLDNLIDQNGNEISNYYGNSGSLIGKIEFIDSADANRWYRYPIAVSSSYGNQMQLPNVTGNFNVKITLDGETYTAENSERGGDDPIISVTVNAPDTIPADTSQTLLATVIPASANQNVTWTLTNSGGTNASITANGILSTGAAPGTITVKATSAADSTKYGTKEIMITPKAYDPVSSVKISNAPSSLNTGSGIILETEVLPVTANPNVIWSIANNGTNAAISPSGFLSAGSIEGTITVMAKSVTDSTKFDEKSISIIAGGGGGGGSSKTPGGGGITSSTTTPATITITVNTSIGGTVSLTDASVTIPASASAEDIKVTIDKLTGNAGLNIPDNMKLVSAIYEFSNSLAGNFDKPVTITMSFDKSQYNPDEYDIAIYWYNENTEEWVKLDNIKLDLPASQISGEVNHFTKFAVFAIKKARIGEEPPAAPKQIEKSNTITDISGHWAQTNIETMLNRGVISGYPDNTFKPDNYITRAEFAAVLVQAFNLPPQTGKVFGDTTGHWAQDYIATAAANGIVSGYSDTVFGPDTLITREQMAVMIVNAKELAPVSGHTNFTDSSQISAWAESAVTTAAETGIIRGYPDNSFKPLNNATRAEAVSVITRALK